MDIGSLYGKYLPLTPAQPLAQRAEQSKSSFRSSAGGLIVNRTNAYAKSSRPKLSDGEIDEIAGKYDFRHMDQEKYDEFLDDLVNKGVLTRAETGYFGYGGTVRLDSLDSKVMVVSVAGQERKYSQNTPFFGDSRIQGNGDMLEWLSELMESTDYSAYPEAFERVQQRCEMYGAIYDVVARAANSPAYAAGSDGEPDIADQIRNPNSDFYQDMYNRMRVQLEQSEEEKRKQAIIDALDEILESLSAKKDDWKKKPDSVSSMAELSRTIDSLDKDDPRKEELNLLWERLQNLGIYMDLDVGVKGKDKNTWGTTLTQDLIREEAKETEPSIFDII